MRQTLLEFGDASMIAIVAGILLLLYAAYRAMTADWTGDKGAAISGLLLPAIIAVALIKIVGFGKGYAGTAIPIYSYGFMIMLGFAGVIYISVERGKVFGIAANHIMDLGLFAMLGGILGARLWHFVQYNDQYASAWDFVKIWNGGIVFYGGLIGGFLCCSAYILKFKLHWFSVAEVVGPSIPMGIAFARMGCFLNGCCYGGVCDAGFPSVQFPAGSPAFRDHQAFGFEHALAPAEYAAGNAAWSLPVHPAQLYASFGAMLLFVALLAYARYLAKRPGESFAMLLVLYAPFRYVMELFRADNPEVMLGMTAGQATGVFLLPAGLIALVVLRLGKVPGQGDRVVRNGLPYDDPSEVPAPPEAATADASGESDPPSE
jgi:phosphatidylglycerol:prolipoprotein diacylglycerol transferase